MLIFSTVLTLLYVVNCMKHEERAREVSAHVKRFRNSTWTPQANRRFVGNEEMEMKKYLGINITELRQLKAKSSHRRPIREHRHRRLSANSSSETSPSRTHQRNKRAETLPNHFDWRNFDCESFRDVRYQNCGDCWAIASASVMSDRYCLWTGRNKIFSARQIVTCAYPTGVGCDGGVPHVAMAYYHTHGVASGGDARITDEIVGCLPYTTNMKNQTRCPKKCDSGEALDATKAGDYREINSQNVTEIMNEIYNYGPVVAIFQVFDDFEYMGTGVYKHVWGNSQGYHAVRLLGYGTDNGTDYWLAVNSWGTGWGDKGYFKILRGQNHCDIESWVATVYPPEAY